MLLFRSRATRILKPLPMLRDTALLVTLEPDNFAAKHRYGLALTGVFHGVEASLFGHGHVAQYLAGVAFQLDYPSGRSGGLIEWLHSRP